MAAESVVRIVFLGDSAQAVRSTEQMEGAVTGLSRSMKLLAVTAGVALAGGLFVVADAVKNGIEGAVHLKEAQDSLAIAIKRTGGNVRELVPQYMAVAKAAAQFGVNQSDATTELARATLLTGDSLKAMHAYQEALVISKATGKDFNQVLTATAKGQIGITTSLQRYGIELKKGTPSLVQYDKVMARFSGQAAANTSAADKLRASFQNLETDIGMVLLPAFDKIVVAINNVVAWFQSPQVLGPISRFARTFVQEVQPAIREVTLLAVQFAETVRSNWPAIRTEGESVGHSLQSTFKAIVQIVRELMPLIKALAPEIKITLALIIVNFRALNEAAAVTFRGVAVAIKAIAPVLTWLVNRINGIPGAIKGALSAIKTGFMTAFGPVITVIKTVIHWIQTLIGWIQKIPSSIHLPSIPGSGIAKTLLNPLGAIPIPGNPFRALGGPVLSGMPYIVGERGPELFVPRGSGAIVPNHGLGGGTVNITLAGDLALAERVTAIVDTPHMTDRISLNIGSSANMRARGGRR